VEDTNYVKAKHVLETVGFTVSPPAAFHVPYCVTFTRTTMLCSCGAPARSVQMREVCCDRVMCPRAAIREEAEEGAAHRQDHHAVEREVRRTAAASLRRSVALSLRHLVLSRLQTAAPNGPNDACLTRSALTQAGIPPGPRLLILHHIDGFRQPLKPGLPHGKHSLSG